MQWLSYWAFSFLILLAAAILYHFWARKKTTASVQFSAVKLMLKLPKPLKVRFVHLPLALKAVALILAIVALARPQISSTKVKRNVEGIDIMIALDISDSMLIEDMTPENRLEASKETIKNFVQGRISDRIGIVAFSGESYTRVPLTLDYPLLLQNISEIQTSRNIKMGTAIGVALANAVARLKDSTAKSRIVILMTDGENNSGTIDPETALDIAEGYGIKIYSIGMGKDGEAQLPVFIEGPNGQKIKRYRPMHSKVNDELLGKMADETGGKYYRAVTSNALAEVFKEINRLEKTKIEVNQYTKYDELYQSYLLWALVFYMLSVVLGRSVLRSVP